MIRAATLLAAVCLIPMASAVARTQDVGVAATQARTCTPPRYPGTGYFTSLSVHGTGCSAGRRLALAYYHCRTRSGPAGRCQRTVLGYSCHERRNSIPTEIDARVRCVNGSRTVVHTYQQDL
jgi:hypothetical protein